eukprot:Anaeramoba_ignava/a91199_2803.p1 GENE.a91199_2803~~a91199_2803.p1  ORF type:complete len:127 (+),score=41.94 a91199_2803:1-381(+)
MEQKTTRINKKKKKRNAFPKKPRNGYFIFCADARQTIKEQYPEMSISEIGKLLGKMWNELDPEEKKKYSEKAKQEQEEYSQKLYKLAEKNKRKEEKNISKPKKKAKKRKKKKTKKNFLNCVFFFNK